MSQLQQSIKEKVEKKEKQINNLVRGDGVGDGVVGSGDTDLRAGGRCGEAELHKISFVNTVSPRVYSRRRLVVVDGPIQRPISRC